MGGMEPFGSIMWRILAERGLVKGVKNAEVVELWEKIVGETIAKHAKALYLESGILFIEVPDSAWRNELSLLQVEVIEKINEYFGERRVERLHIK